MLLEMGFVVCGWLVLQTVTDYSNYEPGPLSGSELVSELCTNTVHIPHNPDVIPPLTVAGIILYFPEKHRRYEPPSSPELNYSTVSVYS